MTRKKDYRVAAVTSSIEEEAGEELLAFIGARPQYKVQQNKTLSPFQAMLKEFKAIKEELAKLKMEQVNSSAQKQDGAKTRPASDKEDPDVGRTSYLLRMQSASKPG